MQHEAMSVGRPRQVATATRPARPSMAPAAAGRVALAGPGAIGAAVVVMLGLPLWLPGGAAGIDNLVVPLVLFPLIWAALFFHACLDSNLWRVGVVAATLAAWHGGLIAWHLSRG